ncbi:Ankyrin repeat protein [Enhygromyxa salina]|uniref:Ankyrin repeat protein n=1 Tax=Enhygromyxa salina TaxID=215803 RepID=A0A0C2CV02_9BACT|nr:ankyrin repeat domain-containing protein [Enhygromyxa salina]KIG14956.1 Ankyrin repeat protein [Enhygromyxa salina]
MSEDLDFRLRLAELERAFLRPARGDLGELAKAIDYRGADPGAAVWARAIQAGKIPTSWANDPTRRFRAARGQPPQPAPRTAQAALLFASDPSGLLAAEAHAKQLVARFEAWGCPPATKVVWRLAGNPVGPTGARPRSFGALAPALARLRVLLGGAQRIYEPPHPYRRFQVVVDALHGSRRWQLIANSEIRSHEQSLLGGPLPPALQGRAFGELPNPLEPWLALALTGYALWGIRVQGQPEPTIELAAPFLPPRGAPSANTKIPGRVVWSRDLTALRLACARGDLATLRRRLPLLPGDDEPEQPRLIHFASYGGPEALELLAEHADGRPDLEARDRLDRTALMLAAGLPTQGPAGAEAAEISVPISELVGAQACAWLLGAGAKRESTDRQGWTALHWAAHAGRLRCAATLLQAGANPNAQDHRGRTPLMLALSQRPVAQLIDLLLSAGADPDARDHHGWSALHYLAASTAGNRQQALARRLVEAGARPSKDRAGRSPAQLCRSLGVQHMDNGPFDPRAAVAAGPGAPALASEATLVERLLDQLVPDPPDPTQATRRAQGRTDDWMVWADWLQSRGDPRGQLVATSLARARLGQRKQQRMAHEFAQLEQAAASITRAGIECADPLAPLRTSPIGLTWTHGFVTAARLTSAGWEVRERSHLEQTVTEAARMLLRHEPLLAELRLHLDGLGTQPVAGLEALDPPSPLRRLVLEGLPPDLPKIDYLRRSFPALRSLWLVGLDKIRSGTLRWPGLRHLRLRHGSTSEWAQGCVDLELWLPDLTHLDFALPAGSRTSAAEIEGATRTLSAIRHVSHLRIGPVTADFAAAILVCAVIPRLRTLELAGVRGSALEVLMRHTEQVGHLQRIRVAVTPTVAQQRAQLIARLRQALPKLELDATPGTREPFTPW